MLSYRCTRATSHSNRVIGARSSGFVELFVDSRRNLAVKPSMSSAHAA
jgi:hypothetical protein